MIRTRGHSSTYATGGAAPVRLPDVDLRAGGPLVLRALATAGHESLAVDIAVHGRCADCAHPAEGAAA